MNTLGECQKCQTGKKVPIIGKRENALCQYHYRIQLQLKSKNKSKSKNVVKTKFSDEDQEVTELARWFNVKMMTSEPVCENCDLFIFISSQKHWHGCQAHVLPKSLFPSVATHPDNHMVLDWYGCNCHGQFDSSWLNASKMLIFPTAFERFLKFESLIAQDERKNIPEVFLKEMEMHGR